jgi:F-type H+-transporting ATPase subunit alpha
MVIYAVVNKHMADIAVKDIQKFESGFVEYLKLNAPEIGKSIAETGNLSEEMETKLKSAIEAFKTGFVVD